MDGKDQRMEVFRAILLLQKRFIDVVQSMRFSVGRQEFSVEQWVDFIGEAAGEIAGCSKRGAPPALTWSAREFPEIAEALNEAMDRKEFSWDRLVAFLCEAQEILNQLHSEGMQQQQEDLVMATGKDSGAEKKVEGHEIVDARELTEKEAAFYAYCAERFDEAAWLKKLHLVSLEAETANV